jgi:hypothetical protein
MSDVSLTFANSRRFALPASPAWIHPFLPPRTVGAYMLFDNGRPFYVGRSDTCLRGRLLGHEHLGAASHVLWERCPSPRQAFHLEAFWYDRLKPSGGLLNRVHPARPGDDDEPCPFCAAAAGVAAALPDWPFPAAQAA